jgi:Cu/Zn superoxide dismutase
MVHELKGTYDEETTAHKTHDIRSATGLYNSNEAHTHTPEQVEQRDHHAGKDTSDLSVRE